MVVRAYSYTPLHIWLGAINAILVIEEIGIAHNLFGVNLLPYSCLNRSIYVAEKNKEDRVIDSREEAIIAARAAADKKAQDIRVLDLRKITVIADYFVICSGESTTQVKAITDWVEETLVKHGIRPLRIEGDTYAHWVLMDYGSVVVHIFETETRAYYSLEKLWIDAEPVAFE